MEDNIGSKDQREGSMRRTQSNIYGFENRLMRPQAKECGSFWMLERARAQILPWGFQVERSLSASPRQPGETRLGLLDYKAMSFSFLLLLHNRKLIQGITQSRTLEPKLHRPL